MSKQGRRAIGAALIMLVGGAGSAFAWGPFGKEVETEAYFGELHLHTGLSTDAFMNGTRKHPSTAYGFAQGEPVLLSSGEEWQLPTPSTSWR